MHAYFYNYLITVFKLIIKMHCMTWYTGTCGITIMGLLYRLNNMVKCVCYMSIGSNGYFVIDLALMGGHYRMDVINGVSHPRLDSILPLVLCIVTYNI